MRKRRGTERTSGRFRPAEGRMTMGFIFSSGQLAALAILAVGCTPSGADPAPTAPTAPTTGTQLPAAALTDPSAPVRPAAADARLENDLVGTTPPAWTVDEWLNSPPLTLAGLRGRVVLVRWFTDTSCPHCSATAPSLKTFDHDYAAKGLTVIGMYHHKDPAPLAPGQYEGLAKTYGFGFPVALDTNWKTLKTWWLDVPTRSFTSVSFLIDRQSRVRGIHPGGRYVQGDADYEAMKRGIEVLLAER
jgi:thiol-disulfide isomerase/thioredoxin